MILGIKASEIETNKRYFFPSIPLQFNRTIHCLETMIKNKYISKIQFPFHHNLPIVHVT